uniref:NADAR domain-containing protein n=1 Tax=Amphora coffeiformis TaxID=265554 RepID=A0A7S3LGZ3_9STRA|mmetsp:Transcript_10034/g.19316  ORF Transcript_10034/g.19316 Transcript_10034/m.19316 type:complete len:192 (+) Transcript_10034:131-706(+)
MGGPATIGGQRLASTSNFLIQPMQIDGVLVRASTGEHSATPLEWKSVEHYFQAAKFDAIAGRMSVWQHCRAIQLVNDPLEAWELGQSRKHPLRVDWEDVKAHTMYLGVVAKYKACPEHARVLAETSEPIVAGDSTSNWQQLNTLVLERIRYELRESLGLSPLVARSVYEEWCAATNLPPGAAPIVVYVATP